MAWCHSFCLFFIFYNIHTYIHRITFLQYIYPSPFAEASLHFFIACLLSGGTSLWCRAENRTRACLTARRRATNWATPHHNWATPHHNWATPHHNWATPHYTELRCTISGYAAPYWATPHHDWATPHHTELRRTITELRRTILSYAAPYWATPHHNWATPHHTELRRTILSYAAPCNNFYVINN